MRSEILCFQGGVLENFGFRDGKPQEGSEAKKSSSVTSACNQSECSSDDDMSAAVGRRALLNAIVVPELWQCLATFVAEQCHLLVPWHTLRNW